jgi:eukaryotic translation initiation factor 2C
MNQIREACSEIAAGYQPGVTYIVVSKRHNTRFFPLDFKDKTGKGENVPPGTLSDTRVVTPDKFDFFLNSHLGIQVNRIFYIEYWIGFHF